jgi:hypothetical protein
MNPQANRAEISCNGKDSLTQGRAVQVAQDMRRRGRKKIQAYHCVHCHGWHVGSRVVVMPDKRRA